MAVSTGPVEGLAGHAEGSVVTAISVALPEVGVDEGREVPVRGHQASPGDGLVPVDHPDLIGLAVARIRQVRSPEEHARLTRRVGHRRALRSIRSER